MHSTALFLFVLTALFALVASSGSNNHHHHHLHNQEQHVMAQKSSLNVLKGPLAFFSNSPMTGFMRNGYCEVPPGDYGNHAVAAQVTEEFLDFSAARGNDLRRAGLTGGCKWCLCASRWREAFDARKGADDRVVPKVFLESTHEKALDKVTLDELKMFKAQ